MYAERFLSAEFRLFRRKIIYGLRLTNSHVWRMSFRFTERIIPSFHWWFIWRRSASWILERIRSHEIHSRLWLEHSGVLVDFHIQKVDGLYNSMTFTEETQKNMFSFNIWVLNSIWYRGSNKQSTTWFFHSEINMWKLLGL